MLRIGWALAAGAVVSSTAIAADRLGYRSIVTGDFATAARTLEAERRIHPQRPELMLNLAVAYQHIDRLSDARALYTNVLARPVAMMDVPSGAVISSHDLATRGLQRLTPELASR